MFRFRLVEDSDDPNPTKFENLENTEVHGNGLKCNRFEPQNIKTRPFFKDIYSNFVHIYTDNIFSHIFRFLIRKISENV